MRSAFIIISVSTLFCREVYAQQSVAWQRANELKIGVNATAWLKYLHIQQGSGFTPYSNADFLLIRQMGFDHVRLPLGLHYWTDTIAPYNFPVNYLTLSPDSTILLYLDSAINWALSNQLKIILDYTMALSDDNLTSANYLTESERIGSIWKKVAQRYLNRSADSIFYELYNEPSFVTANEWIFSAEKIIDSIRSVDTEKTIVCWVYPEDPINPASITDTNVIFTSHFYEPAIFTHQGANFTPVPHNTTGIPFPYDSLAMPPLHPADIGSKNELDYNNYKVIGTVDSVKSLISHAKTYSVQYNVPVYGGEFGVIKYAPIKDKLFWINTVREILDSLMIPCTLWGFKGDKFSMFSCDKCNDMDSLITDSVGYTILCALELDTCMLTQNTEMSVPYFPDVLIYPNPFSHTLRITNVGELRNTNLELRIFDVLGKIVFQSEIRNPQSEIHLDLPNGIYFLQIIPLNSGTNFVQTKKIEIIR